MFAPIAVAAATAAKWVLPALKFGLPFIKMAGFMFLSLWVYAKIYGWAFAAGFILLIFIHETGHLIAARMMGLKVGLPVFIPFMGALIALKEAPPNAWVEAVVGIGGPILGSVGALAFGSIYDFTGNPYFLALAYTGFFLNLFNLIPIVPLDGGRIVSAISPWFWVVGLVIMIGFLILHASAVSFIILLIILTSIRRVFALFRPRTQAQMRYFECTPAQRATMAVLYFTLLASLYFGMSYIRHLLEHPPS
jgi:Zn-dependent protease